LLPYAPFHAHAHPFKLHAVKHSQFGSRYWLSLGSTLGCVALLLWLKEVEKLPIPYSLPFLTCLIGMGYIALNYELASVSVMIALLGLLGAAGVGVMGNYALVMELNFFIPACTLASLLSYTMRHLVAHNRQLTSETLHDPLTGICNRKGLDFYFSAHLRDIQGGRRRLCLASMDLDHFKRVNDTFGHSVGDDVLKRVTRLLQAHTSAVDCIARIGGDEIVILLPGFSLDECVKKIEAIRLGIEAISDLPLRVTASFGVTQVEPHNSQEIALVRADKLLYQAKALGRNRVERDTVPA
jgi:diguanylate cyclase (GGDEF)-like protein